ncbi:MAG: DUF4249 domain-containing protein [Saprospiraceae bacterium]
MKNIIFFLLFITIILSSCEDVVNLDLPDGDLQLVVDGTITNQPGEKRVRLTNTANYFDNKETPKVSNALVLLYNERGVVDTLIEKEAGIYITEYIGQVGTSYHLYIRTPDGNEYESQPELLQAVPDIDSIYYEFKAETPFQDEGYYVKIDTYEPAGLGNHYRWKQYVNGKYKNEPFDLLYATDQFVDGNPILGFEVSTDALQVGDQFRVQQMSISEAAFDFLTLLSQQTANVGSIFDSPPAALPGNIRNITNPKVKALGFFSASAISEATIVIE